MRATLRAFLIPYSAPVLAVSDSVILSQHADEVLFVVRSEVTSFKAAEEGIKRLLNGDEPLLGVVLNQVTSRSYGDGKYAQYDEYYG